jgi:hypothetical protein
LSRLSRVHAAEAESCVTHRSVTWSVTRSAGRRERDRRAVLEPRGGARGAPGHQEFEQALVRDVGDARACGVRLRPEWGKGHGRRGTALQRRGCVASTRRSGASRGRLEDPGNAEGNAVRSNSAHIHITLSLLLWQLVDTALADCAAATCSCNDGDTG